MVEGTQPTIFVIGECMIELQRQSAGLAYRFSGDSLNTAVYLRRQMDVAHFDVAYVSALGTDTLSDEMAAHWVQEGINTGFIQRLPDKLPGIYFIETDFEGERHFQYWRGDSAARYWLKGPDAPRVFEALTNAAFIYLTGISLAILTPADRAMLLKLLAECRNRGGKIFFDNNYRPSLWQNGEVAADVYRRVLALVDTALLTLDDEEALYGQTDVATVIARTHALGVAEVIIRRGAGGCIVDTAGCCVEVPAERVEKIVDTTAAGDSFSAAYLSARLTGRTTIEAARAGHRLAAAVIQHRGAIIPREIMPTGNEISPDAI
jgi:2-dehydro-3-deoxygluconokinase